MKFIRRENFSSAQEPLIKAVVAIAPALTSGLTGFSEENVSSFIRELKESPVGSMPMREKTPSGPWSIKAKAKAKGFETLWRVNLDCTAPLVWIWP